MKKDQKNNKEKINFICFLVASIIFYVVSIMNFIDKDTNTGVVFLCLGSSFLYCIVASYAKKIYIKRNIRNGYRNN